MFKDISISATGIAILVAIFAVLAFVMGPDKYKGTAKGVAIAGLVIAGLSFMLGARPIAGGTGNGTPVLGAARTDSAAALLYADPNYLSWATVR